jgi:hypothetical protein
MTLTRFKINHSKRLNLDEEGGKLIKQGGNRTIENPVLKEHWSGKSKHPALVRLLLFAQTKCIHNTDYFKHMPGCYLKIANSDWKLNLSIQRDDLLKQDRVVIVLEHPSITEYTQHKRYEVYHVPSIRVTFYDDTLQSFVTPPHQMEENYDIHEALHRMLFGCTIDKETYQQRPVPGEWLSAPTNATEIVQLYRKNNIIDPLYWSMWDPKEDCATQEYLAEICGLTTSLRKTRHYQAFFKAYALLLHSQANPLQIKQLIKLLNHLDDAAIIVHGHDIIISPEPGLFVSLIQGSVFDVFYGKDPFLMRHRLTWKNGANQWSSSVWPDPHETSEASFSNHVRICLPYLKLMREVFHLSSSVVPGQSLAASRQ